jgi:hypothetical protein
MWVGLHKKDDRLMLKLTFRDQPLKIVAVDAPVRYLCFYQSPDGCWENMVTRVMEVLGGVKQGVWQVRGTPSSSRKKGVSQVRATPPFGSPQYVQKLRSRPSHVMWNWQTAYKELWYFMRRRYPDVSGGMQCPRPMAILWEATSRHVERVVRHDDVMGRVLWDQGVRDVRKLAREAIPLASRSTLSRHLLFTEESMVDPQEPAFLRTEEQRSGTQEVRILAPRMSLLLQNAKKLDKKLRLHRKSLLS